MNLEIMLPLRNEAELDNLLERLYDPMSPFYRQYLSVQEFAERFGPSQEDYDAVVAFAKANGMTVTGVAPNRLVVEVSASVASVEKAFQVLIGVYQRPTGNGTFYAPDREPSAHLNVPLWHVAGLDDFSEPRPMYRQARAGVRSNTTGSGPGGSFLGSDRRKAYYGGTSLTGSGQAVGLFEFDGYNLSDVTNYFTNAGQTRNVPINNVLLLGASGGSDGDDTEQVADIVEAISMAPGMSQVLVYIAPNSAANNVAIFNKMASDNIAKQLSVSWQWTPADPLADDPIFKEFATQGQSLFVSSGDHGSYPNSSGDYYPSEDANVTAVGGTELTTNGAGGAWLSETAWGGSGNLCGSESSGGGISQDGIAIPSYQQIAGVITSSNHGSTTLRNVPDVAAEANCDNYYCANGGCGGGIGGTSLAAPTWAGFMALVNQQDGSAGRGFLNPIIYPIGTSSSHGSFFHDITSGSNGTFSAVSGYDLVTGWGSPQASGWMAFTTVSPNSLSFGVFQNLSAPPVYKTDTITNIGTGTMTISSMQVTNNTGFSISSTTCGATLAAGASCTVTVEFNPANGIFGTNVGNVEITDTALNTPTMFALLAVVKCPPSGCP